MTRLLLVEDNRADARLFAELLKEVPTSEHVDPFVLTTVDTLAAAIAVAAGHDVVFLDLTLPDAHGIGTIAAMRAAALQTPIVVLTGNNDDRLALEVVKAGAQDYLRKSEINPSLIARTAWYAIERRKVDEATRRVVLADDAARRARFTSSVTSAINASFDLTATLGEVTQLLVPTLADFCVIDLVHESRLVRVAHAARDAELERVLGSSAYRFSVDGSAVRRALDAGTSLVLGEAELAVVSPADDSYRRATARAGARSMLVTPLVARDHQVGAITYVSTSADRQYESADLRLLAEEVGHRVAVGIDNARLYSTAQNAVRARDELLAVVSHDLRNPLGVVALALGMIEKDVATVPNALPRAKRGVERMQRLIDDLLDLARIEAGTLKVAPVPIVLGTFLEDAIEQHRTLAQDKGIALVRAFEGRVGAALADRHRLAQAVSNLLGNAVKYTPAGGTVRVNATVRADGMVIEVADTGPGIAREHLEHIWDRYYQPEQRRDGIGLGLAIVKGILDAHGGAVEVESETGKGSTFRLVLQRARDITTASVAALEE